MSIGTIVKGKCSCGMKGTIRQECRNGSSTFYRWYCYTHRPRYGHSVGNGYIGPKRGTYGWFFMRIASM